MSLIESVNLFLGITASLLTIWSLVWNRSNANKIKGLSIARGGNNSVNTSGNKNTNTVTYGKR